MNIKRVFTNTLTRRTFLMLLISVILINLAAYFMFSIYAKISTRQLQGDRLGRTVNQIINVAKTVPPDIFPEVLNHLYHPGLTAYIKDEPAQGMQNSTPITAASIKKIVAQQPENFRLTYPLNAEKQLVITSTLKPIHGLKVQFGFAIALLLIPLILLSLWIVERLAKPLDEFAVAAKQFSRNLDAPAITEQGPTEVRATIREFNNMQTHLRRLINDRTKMLAAISHDLRTPITKLKLRIESHMADKEQKRALTDLADMEQMIDSILVFAKEHLQNEPTENFDLDSLLQSICDDMSDMGRDVNYQEPEHKIILLGRINAFKRAITNFIDNAIKYGNKAEVSLSQTDHHTQIKIRDHGPGIPDDQLERVFTPFYRIASKNNAEIRGSGLGMTIARDIIQAHAGEVTLANAEDGGLVVTITL